MTTWIFLRGLTRESRHWGTFPSTFRAAIPDAVVVTPDLPGNGRLHQLRSPSTVEKMAEYCRTELRSLGMSPPYQLLAMSLGAMVAVAWATRHPEELRGCVLINTSLRPFNPFYQRLRPANYITLLRLILMGGTDRDWEETIQLADNWKADIVEHPSAGHDIPLDDGPWVARQVREWLLNTR